jgi:septal ring factor EnvC (AmiA/AmiB activator)
MFNEIIYDKVGTTLSSGNISGDTALDINLLIALIGVVISIVVYNKSRSKESKEDVESKVANALTSQREIVKLDVKLDGISTTINTINEELKKQRESFTKIIREIDVINNNLKNINKTIDDHEERIRKLEEKD